MSDHAVEVVSRHAEVGVGISQSTAVVALRSAQQLSDERSLMLLELPLVDTYEVRRQLLVVEHARIEPLDGLLDGDLAPYRFEIRH